MPRLTRGDAAIFLLPALLVMLVITLYPFVYTVVLSFHNWNLVAFQPRRFVGLDNYLASALVLMRATRARPTM
jgi:ABC-type sugar transport system permease subunit